MTIGLDIDNVIADLDKTFLDEFLIEDKKKRNKGIINPEAEHMTQGMFDWTKEEIEEFLDNNMERMASNFEVVENAKYYIDKLIEDGNKIYLITGRNKRFKNKEKTTIDWLEKNNINYDKLIFSCNNGDKSSECIKNHVDIMFDDRPLNCIKLRKKGIKSYLFKTRYNYNYSLNVEIIDNWSQLYNLIKKMRGNNMKIASNEARNLLELERANSKDDRWIDHCICVGNTAGKIAKALSLKGINVDIDKTITLGYIHDIGKYNGESKGHVMRGYEYLKEKGYDSEYCNICLTHSYLNNDIICTAGGVPDINANPFLTNFIKNHDYSIEEKLINLCDLMCPQGDKVYTIDKRLINIMIRRGAHSNTQYHIKETYKLKEYFDNLLGYNLYNLFPEIKENL